MNQSIIKLFFEGALAPNEQSIPIKSPEYKKGVARMHDLEDELLKEAPEEFKGKIKELIDLHIEINAAEAKEVFANGFVTAALFFLEIFERSEIMFGKKSEG